MKPGYDDEMECIKDLTDSGDDAELSACIDEVFATEPLVEQNLECETSALVDLNACLAPLECTDFGTADAAADACWIDWLDAHEACPAVPGSVWNKVEVCRGRVCGDGSTIPDESVCDGAPDCKDGSDEANCS